MERATRSDLQNVLAPLECEEAGLVRAFLFNVDGRYVEREKKLIVVQMREEMGLEVGQLEIAAFGPLSRTLEQILETDVLLLCWEVGAESVIFPQSAVLQICLRHDNDIVGTVPTSKKLMIRLCFQEN